jgi:hypothetical protein
MADFGTFCPKIWKTSRNIPTDPFWTVSKYFNGPFILSLILVSDQQT